MKGLSVVLILLVLVAGIAVRGSLAQPLTQATSAAYQQCTWTGKDISLERCRRTGPAVPEQTEAELAGSSAMEAVGGIGADGDVAGGERWAEVARAITSVLLNLLNIINALQVVGGGLPQGAELAAIDTMFDPVR